MDIYEMIYIRKNRTETKLKVTRTKGMGEQVKKKRADERREGYIDNISYALKHTHKKTRRKQEKGTTTNTKKGRFLPQQ